MRGSTGTSVDRYINLRKYVGFDRPSLKTAHGQIRNCADLPRYLASCLLPLAHLLPVWTVDRAEEDN